jgi:hypothetical protein
MLNRFFGENTHTHLHILGLSGLAFGLPFNKVVMSISMMFLVLNLLLEADFRKYFSNIRNNRAFLILLLFFSLHFIGLLWSSNMDYGFHDLRVKLPLLIVPLVLVAKPVVNPNRLSIVLAALITSLLFTSLYNFFAYKGLIGAHIYDDIRGMSLFSSHVRYSLLIVMGVAILLFNSNWKSNSLILTRIALIAWFVFYTYYSQVLSGMLCLSGVLFTGLIYLIWRYNRWLALGSFSVVTITSLIVAVWIFKPITFNSEDYNDLPYRTAEGNIYYHKPVTVTPETKKPIEIYICDVELEREWEKVSQLPYDARDVKGQPIRATLIRYMSSLDLKKDAEGFKSLKSEDIRKIENGHASKYTTGLIARVYGLQYQLNNTDNPNGHSFLQRIEYWKTGLIIAKNNLLIGVGTGDVQDIFDSTYDELDSPLNEENRRRSHNMYLTVLLTFGIGGLFVFLWMHSEYLIQNLKKERLIAVSFIVIILLSYCVEDTLETQTGVTFFALFYGLFLPRKK